MIRSVVTQLAAAADRSVVAVLRAVALNVAPNVALNAVQTVRRFLTDETQPAAPDVVLNVVAQIVVAQCAVVRSVVVQCAAADCYAARDCCAVFRSPAGPATASQLLPA